jgi:2-oxoglutarate dehydrogenase E2 component (dihydrolipoamide succinyltransferase)
VAEPKSEAKPEAKPEPKPKPKAEPKAETVKVAQPATTGDVQPKTAAATETSSSRQPDDPGPDPAPEKDGWTRKLAGG